MAGERRPQPTTPGRAGTAPRGKVIVPTRSGGDRRPCAATIGCGQDMSQRVAERWEAFRVHKVLPSTAVAQVVARSQKAPATTFMPARMGTSTAKIPAAVGASMKGRATGIRWTPRAARQAAQNAGVTRESASQAAQQRAGTRAQTTPSQTAARPSLSPETSAQLNREATARQTGDYRASQQRQYQNSGGWSRGGGGWSRGGGGRRR